MADSVSALWSCPMADPSKKLNGNVPGEFYVDASCIDCDLCRQIAPEVFREEEEASVVARQPGTPSDALRAEMALVTCPTASIGTLHKRDLSGALAAFPEPIEENVHFCGFASEASFGGSSYLIVRPGGAIGRVGVPHYETIPQAQPMFYRNVSVGGGPAPVRAYIAELLPDVLEGRIEPGLVFDRVVDLEGVPDGYRAMDARESIKVMVKP